MVSGARGVGQELVSCLAVNCCPSERRQTSCRPTTTAVRLSRIQGRRAGAYLLPIRFAADTLPPDGSAPEHERWPEAHSLTSRRVHPLPDIAGSIDHLPNANTPLGGGHLRRPPAGQDRSPRARRMT